MSHYVKFTYQRARPDIAPFDALAELNACRRKLLEQRLIGRGLKRRRVRQLERPRHRKQEFLHHRFSDGGLPELTPTDCVRVVAYDFARNWLRYEGAAIPSSESLTHAAIYESDPSASAVIHCHDSVLWATLLDRVPTTSNEVSYGTLEMASNHASVHGERCAKQRDFRHGGTRRRHSDFRGKSRGGIRCSNTREEASIDLAKSSNCSSRRRAGQKGLIAKSVQNSRDCASRSQGSPATTDL